MRHAIAVVKHANLSQAIVFERARRAMLALTRVKQMNKVEAIVKLNEKSHR